MSLCAVVVWVMLNDDADDENHANESVCAESVADPQPTQVASIPLDVLPIQMYPWSHLRDVNPAEF